MEMKTSHVNEIAILELAGRFDAYAAPEVDKYLTQVATQSPARVIVDLAGIHFIDSTGLATLVKGMKRCREQHGDLHLCNLQGAVRVIIELTRLDKAFAIFDTQDEAQERFTHGDRIEICSIA